MVFDGFRVFLGISDSFVLGVDFILINIVYCYCDIGERMCVFWMVIFIIFIEYCIRVFFSIVR